MPTRQQILGNQFHIQQANLPLQRRITYSCDRFKGVKAGLNRREYKRRSASCLSRNLEMRA
ncbi:hypothetical protein OIU79_023278 [Salix purpurea]|uniref:Uncharacterized protein n=1 Tax=Salix purpurea TaxID=77065 RepID=A0A9Q0W866_SALPP|nr:hypothetical protein OIU79_023278 [Salix purpurea]